jgi:hypothetical protein
MKKNILYFITGCFTFMYSVSHAQPTLTAIGSNPVVGDHFSLVKSNYVNPGNAGANQTWNLSAMTNNSTHTFNAVTVSSTPDGTNFPNATVVFDGMPVNTYSYFKTSSSVQQNCGYATGFTYLSYSDPEDLLRFPFTYNTAYNDHWAGTYINSGFTIYRKGITTVTADGYGTLITPEGSISNVLRINVIQNYTDSSDVFGTTTTNNNQFLWYKDGTHYALAFLTASVVSGTAPTQDAGYLSGNTVGISDITNSVSEYSVSPTLASDYVKLNFTLTENKKVNVNVFNTLGQSVQTAQTESGIQGTNTIELDVATLPEGIYFAQIMLDGTVAGTKRFVVSK